MALMKWIDELTPGQGKISMTGASMVQFSAEQKKDAVVALCTWSTSADEVYLSPIVDCFDGMVVSWSVGTSPNAKLVNSMLDNAVACLSVGSAP